MTISKEFEEALGGGLIGLVSRCVCGRTHFFDDGDERDGWEESELEDLRLGAGDKPALFIPHEDEEIRTRYFDGMAYVLDCPCRRLESMEHFLWRCRDEIADYLRARLNREVNERLTTLGTLPNGLEMK